MRLGLLVLACFLSACSVKRDKYIRPNSLSCDEQSIQNEYIVVDRDGNYIVTRRPPSPEELQTDKIRWYEPNYRVQLEERINRRLELRDGKVVVSELLTNEHNWKLLGVDKLWNENFFGQGVAIAVIDTGVDFDASYLDNRWVYNLAESQGGTSGDGLDNDGNGLVDDIRGWNFVANRPENFDEWNHGTQMAHIIAASKDSPVGPGLAPQSEILPIDFMGEDGGDEVSAVAAIDYAVSRGVKIINNSWVTPCSQLLRSTLNKHSKEDVLIINAAGNQGRLLDGDKNFSSNIVVSNLISVGSVDRMGKRSSFSNYGNHILFYAPGEGMLTFFGPRVSESAGTSFSAAVVSGAAALLWSKYPDYTALQIKSELFDRAYKPNEERDFFNLKLD
jgi:subtilisin family serine protease